MDAKRAFSWVEKLWESSAFGLELRHSFYNLPCHIAYYQLQHLAAADGKWLPHRKRGRQSSQTIPAASNSSMVVFILPLAAAT